jgi:peptidoglycan/LPS O-acetylase OafA/YrhL
MEQPAQGAKIGAAHYLRGIASLAVCWFHFTNGNTRYLDAGFLKFSGSYGWLGVDAFFVISGFVIPYSLFNKYYRVQSFPRFLLKRIVRLDPPYLTSILLILILGYASSMSSLYTGASFAINWPQLCLHLAYLNAFFHKGWLNPVFWSLAIEFQYYLFMGLCFPLVLSRKRTVRLMSAGGLCVLALSVTSESLVFRYLFLFLMGSVLAQYYVKVIRVPELLLMYVPLTIGCTIAMGWKEALVGIISVCIVMVPAFQSKLLTLLGDISYSLYLVHVPIGGRVINLIQRFAHNEVTQLLGVLLAMALSLAGAYVLFRFVEKPSMRLSAAVRYTRTSRFEQEKRIVGGDAGSADDGLMIVKAGSTADLL